METYKIVIMEEAPHISGDSILFEQTAKEDLGELIELSLKNDKYILICPN